MTGQFIDHVDPGIIDLYREQTNRTMSRAKSQGGMFGGMMGMAANMSRGMQGQIENQMRTIMEYPPLVTILKCMNCGAALSVVLPKQT